MRKILAPILLCCVFAPALATAAINQPTAANPRPPLSTKCPKGVSSEAPQQLSIFLNKNTKPEEAEKFLNTAMYCPNACYELKVLVRLEGNTPANAGTRVIVDATHVCSDKTKAPNDPAQAKKWGCVKGESEPFNTITTKDFYWGSGVFEQFRIQDSTTRKSRCDDEATDQAIKKFFAGAELLGDSSTRQAGTQQMYAAISDMQSNTDPRPNAPKIEEVPVPQEPSPKPPELTEAQQKLIGALEGRGVSTADAQIMAMSDPKTAAAMFEKLEENDITAAKTYGRKLGINEDILNSFSSISIQDPPNLPKPEDVAAVTPSPSEVSTVTGGKAAPAAPAPLPGGRYGQMFKTVEDESGLTQRGLSGYLASNAKVENPGGNPSTCAPAWMSSACGNHQYTVGTWDQDSRLINGGVPLHPDLRKDPEISARVTAAAAVRDHDKYKDMIAAIGMNPKAGVYVVHNLGSGGGPRFMNGVATYGWNAPVSSVLTPTEINNNRGLYGNGSISFAEAQNNMLRKMNSNNNFAGAPAIGGGSPYRVAGGGVSSWSVYYSSMPFGYSQSPYGYANPFYYYGQTGNSIPTSYGGYYTGGTGGYYGGGGSSPFSWITNLFSSLMRSNNSQPPRTTPSVPTTPTTPTIPAAPVTPSTPAQGVATIIAQPQKVYVGNSIVVSWSSVGTRANSPCTAKMKVGEVSTILAIANEGSKVVKASSTGAVQFVIECTSTSGASLQNATSVTVQ